MQHLTVFKIIIGYYVLMLLNSCASIPNEQKEPGDPFVSYNRAVHQFNSKFDKTIFQPIARGYREITPAPVDRGITNFFSNLRDVTSAANNLLQLKLSRSASDVGRVVVNSTVGILGLVDVASKLDLPNYKEDFGQTLGHWGVGPGPYLVMPIWGPSNLRDAISMVPDGYAQPIAYIEDNKTRIGLVTLYSIDTRADLLEASKTFEEAALDSYIFTRDAYLQKRRSDIYDGDPPSLEEDNETAPTATP